jgi:hypothetical protein
MNRRKFLVAAVAAAIAPAAATGDASDLGWLQYADDIHLRVHASRLGEVLRTARESFRGYGVEVLDQEWCNVYIYAGPLPTKFITSTKNEG